MGKKGCIKNKHVESVTLFHSLQRQLCVRLRGGGEQCLIFTSYCLDFSSSSSSLSLHYIVGLIAGGLETVRVCIEMSLVEREHTVFQFVRLTHKLLLRTWRSPVAAGTSANSLYTLTLSILIPPTTITLSLF